MLAAGRALREPALARGVKQHRPAPDQGHPLEALAKGGGTVDKAALGTKASR